MTKAAETLISMMRQAPTKLSMQDKVKAQMQNHTNPNDWNLDCRETMALVMCTSPDLGTKLLTPEQYRHFISLLDTARGNYSASVLLSDAQNQLFYSTVNPPEYIV